MSKIVSFEELAVKVYDTFGSSRDFGFKDQICRASVSISNNIAEGYARESRIEFNRFLNIARSSCTEVKSMLYLSEKLKYTTVTESLNLRNDCDEIIRIIRAFSNALLKSTNN
jgi:four helix bundle protein